MYQFKGPSGQPSGDLLKEPATAIRIAERGEGTVTGMLWVRTAHATPAEQVRLVSTGVHDAGVAEHLAHLNPAAE
jgi:hypothetical protein